MPHPRGVSQRELAAIMRNPNHAWFVAIALVIAACAATPGDKGSATQHKRDRLEGVPLVWKPTNQPGSLNVTEFAGTAEVKAQLDPIADTRQNPGLLGENRERNTPRKVTTPDNVAAFVTDKFRMLIYQSGIDVVNSGATVIIRPDLRSFYVDELYTYRGDVRIGVTVIDPSGKVLWRGIAAGSMGRFGRSYKADNYYETLSDSLIDAVDNLLKNPSFLRALSGQGATEQVYAAINFD
jgi:hypothetical protein